MYGDLKRRYHLQQMEPPTEEIPSLHTFTSAYLDWVKETRSIYTWRSYRTSLRKLETIGDVPLDKVTTERIDKLAAKELKAGVSAISVNTMLRQVKAAMTKAFEWHGVKRPKITFLPVTARTPSVVSVDKSEAVLRAAEPRIREMILAYLVTGRRRQELLRLTWEDIDLAGHRYFVRQTKAHLSGWFPMQSTFEEILKARPEEDRDGAVFGGLHPDTVTHYIGKLLKAAGTKARLHDLRHTFATAYLENGGSIQALRRLLGHQQLSTTQIYEHLAETHLAEELKRVPFAYPSEETRAQPTLT
ncbi:MAG: tyrosine-type recombinase/integrase [Chlorobiaceae bacterium]|nr:tyrosine-type recombinase/integrase [Chlorobiaceae bacterium]